MAGRQARRNTQTDVLAQLAGEALGEGLIEGLRPSLATVREELAPLHEVIYVALKRDLSQYLEQLKQIQAEEAELLVARICEEEGCKRRAVARGLCRRHYARLTYRERRERMGFVTRGRRREEAAGAGEKKVKKKEVAPVAPIVRRKKEEEEKLEAARALPPPQADQSGAVSVENVARFFGLDK